uniref:Uncharacterized protein n=1 Tax=Corethron hystrix TaxID=216773 RepID=A0A7S1BKR3_9STRA
MNRTCNLEGITPVAQDRQFFSKAIENFGTPSSVLSNPSVPSPVRPICLSQDVLDMELYEEPKEKLRKAQTSSSVTGSKSLELHSKRNRKESFQSGKHGSNNIPTQQKMLPKSKRGKTLDIFAANSPKFSPSYSSKYSRPASMSTSGQTQQAKKSKHAVKKSTTAHRKVSKLASKPRSKATAQTQGSRKVSLESSKTHRARRKKKKNNESFGNVDDNLDFSFG